MDGTNSFVPGVVDPLETVLNDIPTWATHGSYLSTLYDKHFVDLIYLGHNWTGITIYKSERDNVRNDLRDSYGQLVAAAEGVKTALRFLERLQHYFWNWNCETLVGMNFHTYRDGHTQSQGLLTDLETYVTGKIDEIENLQVP